MQPIPSESSYRRIQLRASALRTENSSARSFGSIFSHKQAVSALISAAEKSPFERLDVERQCEELEQARRETKDSKLHQIDLGFRKAVSVLIKEGEQRDLLRWKQGLFRLLDVTKVILITMQSLKDS